MWLSIDNNKIAELEKFEKKYKTKYFEVSVLTNENINESIKYVITEAFYQFIYDEEIL